MLKEKGMPITLIISLYIYIFDYVYICRQIHRGPHNYVQFCVPIKTTCCLKKEENKSKDSTTSELRPNHGKNRQVSAR